MLIPPFDVIVIDIIADKRRQTIGGRQHNARQARPVVLVITLEPVIVRDDVAIAPQHTEMTEPHPTIVADHWR